MLGLGFLLCRFITQSKLGRLSLAIRDAESRVRFFGYSVTGAKLLVWTVSAILAGIAGALYVPQVGIINPSEFSPANSIEIAIWVAVGGRGTLVGALLGAGLVNYAESYFTRRRTGALAVRAGRPVRGRDAVLSRRNRRHACQAAPAARYAGPERRGAGCPEPRECLNPRL